MCIVNGTRAAYGEQSRVWPGMIAQTLLDLFSFLPCTCHITTFMSWVISDACSHLNLFLCCTSFCKSFFNSSF